MERKICDKCGGEGYKWVEEWDDEVGGGSYIVCDCQKKFLSQKKRIVIMANSRLASQRKNKKR